MTTTSPKAIGLALLAISLSTHALADDILKSPFSIVVENETVTAVKNDETPIEQHMKNFTFNWDQQGSIAANQAKVKDEEAFIATLTDTSKLTKEDQHALGLLLYNLGAYYAHVAREPELAIRKLSLANAFLTDKHEKAWCYNQLAYAYEQEFAATHKPIHQETTLYYTNKVIAELYPKMNNPTVAFAYAIQGLAQANANNYVEATKNLKTALKLYQALSSEPIEPYVRTQSRLANVLLRQPGHDQEAIALLIQAKKYWATQGNLLQSPYAARNLIYLGQAYLKTGQAKQARHELEAAITIYKNVYGKNSPLLVQPNQLLAEANKSQ